MIAPLSIFQIRCLSILTLGATKKAYFAPSPRPPHRHLSSPSRPGSFSRSGHGAGQGRRFSTKLKLHAVPRRPERAAYPLPAVRSSACPSTALPPPHPLPAAAAAAAAPLTWLAGSTRSPSVSPAVLVVGTGIAVVGVGFGGVVCGGSTHALVGVLVRMERFAIGCRGRRSVAMRGASRRAVEVGVRCRRLG